MRFVKGSLLESARRILVLVCIVSGFGTVAGQQTVFGRLVDHVESLVSELPGPFGNQYQDPSAAQIALFNDAVAAVIHKDYTTAVSLAGMFDYTLIRFIDNTLPNNQEYFVLQKTQSGQNYWGAFIYNHNACREVVLQCPHPVLDSNTGLEGAYLFSRLKARAMMVSGTHRCNSTTATQCSGSTSVCGSSAPYRISDIAHNDNSIFQHVTEFLADDDPDLLFIQLHGFAKLAGDPNLIISNGTRDTPDPDPIDALRQSLLDSDPSITFRIIHIDTDWTRLTAFTNTQGRYLNVSPDVCSANAFSSTGRFMHIEQEYDLFRDDETGWDLMLQGLLGSTDCMATGIQEAGLDAHVLSDHAISFTGFEDGRYVVEIYFLDGRLWARKDLIPDLPYTLPENTFCIGTFHVLFSA